MAGQRAHPTPFENQRPAVQQDCFPSVKVNIRLISQNFTLKYKLFTSEMIKVHTERKPK